MPRRFASWEDVEKAEKASLGMLETESWVIPYCQDIEIKLLYGNGKVAEQTLRRFSNESDRFLRIQQYPSGATMLHVVACEDTSDMIPLLINYGAEVDALDSKGRTPLMIASLWGRIKNVVKLLENGADPMIRDHGGLSAIDLSSPSAYNDNERGPLPNLWLDSTTDIKPQRDLADLELRDLELLD
jgi:hypothetical protein